jgi:hypothetical protein
MRVLAVWLTMVASEPSLPTRQAEAAKSAPVATAAAGAEVEGLIVIAPRRAEEPDWSKRLNLDVRGDFGSVDTPYLRRRPTNGCKVMAGGARSPSGASGAAGGLVCAKAF